MSHEKNNKFRFKHSLGQNFITDEFLLEDIADESGINEEDFVLEIGPGNGALTRCLCERAKHVVTVEIDKSLIPLLKSNLKDYKNVSIINADFLNYDFDNIVTEFIKSNSESNVAHTVRDDEMHAVRDDGVGADTPERLRRSIATEYDKIPLGNIRPIKVVANLPYYITSPIIQNLLQNSYISEMTLMVQKEVAERIVAVPGNKDFGVLTLACNYYADTEMIMVVSKDCFFPKPKVDSAVVHFVKHKEFIDTNVAHIVRDDEVHIVRDEVHIVRDDEVHIVRDDLGSKHCEHSIEMSSTNPNIQDPNYEKIFKLIKASFAQRRKKLLNSLTNAGYDKTTISNAFSKLNFDENVRAENLSLEDYKNLMMLI
jgi:16S rRNA (adenine1518-N6/adenine1519-N6)-dimethyltransferase